MDVLHFWPQSCFITDRSGNCLVDNLGYFEQLTVDLGFIADKLDIDAKLPHTNSSGKGDYLESYSDRAIERISTLYKLDINRLGYTFDGFTKMMPRRI